MKMSSFWTNNYRAALNCNQTDLRIWVRKQKIEARFVREVTMMSKVQYKNLVKFIGACKDPVMVIATELLPAMSLRKYMLNLRPKLQELHVAIGFALDIAQAMDCLRANGIIHRDLKPGVGA